MAVSLLQATTAAAGEASSAANPYIGGIFALIGVALGLFGQYVVRRMGPVEVRTRKWGISYSVPDEREMIPFRPGTAETDGKDAEDVFFEVHLDFYNHKELTVGLTDLRVCFLRRGGKEVLVEHSFARSEERERVAESLGGIQVMVYNTLTLEPRVYRSIYFKDVLVGEQMRQLHQCDRAEFRARQPGWGLRGGGELQHELAWLDGN